MTTSSHPAISSAILAYLHNLWVLIASISDASVGVGTTYNIQIQGPRNNRQVDNIWLDQINLSMPHNENAMIICRCCRAAE